MAEKTIRDVIIDYYQINGFDVDGGESASYVKIEVFKGFWFYLPNNDARKKLILLHDIHHLLTGYGTKLKDECEISAWELSAGCRTAWVAFVLNTLAFALGTFIVPNGIWRAWKRGKVTKNLYRANYSKEQLLNKTVESLKREMGFTDENEQMPRKYYNVFSFIGFSIFSLVFALLSSIAIPFVMIYSALFYFRK